VWETVVWGAPAAWALLNEEAQSAAESLIERGLAQRHGEQVRRVACATAERWEAHERRGPRPHARAITG
jgi:hypothetical protein